MKCNLIKSTSNVNGYKCTNCKKEYATNNPQPCEGRKGSCCGKK